MAGYVTAFARPLTTDSTTSIQMRAVPAITSTAAAPWLAPRTTIGRVWAASTTPRALEELLIERTAKASATPAIEEPAMLTVTAIQYHRRLSCRSAANES